MQQHTNIPEQITTFEAREAELRTLWARVVAMAAEIEEEYNKHNFEAVQWWRENLPGVQQLTRTKEDGSIEVCLAPLYDMISMTQHNAMPETIAFFSRNPTQNDPPY